MDRQLSLNHDLYGSSSLLDGRFYALVEDRRLGELRDVRWSADSAAREAGAAALDAAMTFRSDGYTRVLVEFDGGAAVVAFAAASSRIDASIAAPTAVAAAAIEARLHALFPPAPPHETDVDVEFWTSPGRGPMWQRRLAMVSWSDIRDNYHPATAASLDPLFAAPTFDGGKLVLWHGEPGTGKTHALRAVMAHHAAAADFHYVTDPEHFFGERSDYMLRVLLSGAEAGERWKLIILEDAGELLAVDARARVGQALSRLLNACDGLVGQGLHLMVVITTNEDVGKMHPAVSRPGRCFNNVEFRRFDPEAASLWLKQRGLDTVVSAPRTVAQLYAQLNGDHSGGDPPARFGF